MRIALGVLLCAVPFQAPAQMTNAETIATNGCRIFGAAKACGVDGARIAATGERMFRVVNARAASERERGSATSLCAAANNVGVEQVASGKVSCRDARAAFEEIERQLARY
jgi:hypothetical protein